MDRTSGSKRPRIRRHKLATAILGAVWIPALALVALLALTGVLVLLHEATKRIHEWKRRR